MKYLSLLFAFVLTLQISFAQEKGIINNSDSPFVPFKSINIGDCQWTTGFWADKFKVCEDVMIPNMGNLLCGDTGHALNNFKIAAGLKEGQHRGMRWHDGDFYKWLEAALYVYAQNKNPQLLQEIDSHIEVIGKAQRKDGYLQTQAQLRDDIDRFDNRGNHEMYNSGHLYTAAVIHYRVTGQRNFLDIAIKHADLLHTIFYPETKHFGRFGFNQTQIMGLVELYRTTKDGKYLKLAEKFIDRRGRYPVKHSETTKSYPVGDMVQERTPLRESEEAVGHAVLALYFYAGAADVYAETGEQSLLDALNRLWNNITAEKMYLTGAVGQAHYGVSHNRDLIQEGFTDNYSLPNMTAYNETCANVCNSMFNYRMLGVTGQAKFVDVMEQVLYNSALSGISLEGKDYFYSNPLRMVHDSRDYGKMKSRTESAEREPYIECFCCPPNLVRTIAKVSGWAYSLTPDGISVNLYGGNKVDTKLLDGSRLRLSQETNYPWNGKVEIEIEECRNSAFEVLIRIPEWTQSVSIQVNGKEARIDANPGTFAKVKRRWKRGDQITIDMPMEASFVEGHPRIEEIRNQVAVKRGPVVYCLESPDLPQNTNILDVYISGGSSLEAEFQSQLLGGVSTINTTILVRNDQDNQTYGFIKKPSWNTHSAKLVPYYAWSNRGLAEMTVFLPIVWNQQ